MSSWDRREAFKRRLFDLMLEFDVTMEIEESHRGMECFAVGVTFHGYGTWDDEGNEINPPFTLELGRYENGKE
jgi:hypothetical protein